MRLRVAARWAWLAGRTSVRPRLWPRLASSSSASVSPKRHTRRWPSDLQQAAAVEEAVPQEEAQVSEAWQVVAYATAEDYRLEEVGRALVQQGLYQPSSKAEDIHDVLHLTASLGGEEMTVGLTFRRFPYQAHVQIAMTNMVAIQYSTGGQESRQLYLFREGSVVFWNVSEMERSSILSFLRPFEHLSHDDVLVNSESEVMSYSYTDNYNKTRLVNDCILLNGEGSLDLEKYTFSNAMARSVKLGVWEAMLDRFVENTEHVVEELKNSGRIRLNQEEVLRKSGELFALRHLMNLSSDLLSTPDFYWDRDNLESLYRKTCNHLNITRRTTVMNEKLNYCCQLVELLSSHLQDRHHVRLEWMIISLIMVEVGFELLHFLR